MIKLKHLVEKIQIQENSLYKDQAEKDTLVANKARLYDAFYINFLGFVGLLSISFLAPLKKYSQTEGQLMVKNISDNNHDVSLSIKLLADQNMIPANVVNQATRLLAKIKQQQMKSTDVDEQLIRKLLIDMGYSSRKGTPLVMNVVTSFVDGSIDLKHAAVQFYELAKRKEYQKITSEYRALCLRHYTLTWFKKIGPVPQQGTTVAPTPVAATQPATIPNAAVQPQPAAMVPTKPQKDATFWNKLYNVRGRVDAIALFDEYQTDPPTQNEFVANFELARQGGPVSLKKIDTSWGVIGYNLALYSLEAYTPFFDEAISKYNDINDAMKYLVDITDAKSLETLKTVLFNHIAANPALNGKVVQMYKVLLNSITQPQYPTLSTEAKLINSLAYFLVHHKDGVFDSLSTPQLMKLFWLTGGQSGVIRKAEIKNRLGEYVKLAPQTSWSIMKGEWEQQVPAEIRKIIDEFNLKNELSIVIADGNKFDSELAQVKDMSTLATFLNTIAEPLAQVNANRKLDSVLGEKVARHAITLFDKVQSVNDLYSRITSHVSAVQVVDGMHLSDYFYNAALNHAIEKLANDPKNSGYFVRAVSGIRSRDAKIDNISEKMRKVEPLLVQAAVNELNTSGRLDYGDWYPIMPHISSDFLNQLIIKTVGNYSKWTSRYFETLPTEQILPKETAVLIFKAMEQSGWTNGAMSYVVKALTASSREMVGKWFAEFVKGKALPPSMPIWVLSTFDEFPVDAIDMSSVSLADLTSRLIMLKPNQQIPKLLRERIVSAMQDGKDVTSSITTMCRVQDTLISDVLEGMDSQQSSDVFTQVAKKMDGSKVDFEAIVAANVMTSLSDHLFTTPGGIQIIERYAEYLAKPTLIDKAYRESAVTEIANLFASADVDPASEAAFAKFDKKAQKMLAVNFATAQFAGGAVEEINENAVVKPRSKLPAKGALKVLKLNQVSIPASNIIDFRKVKGNVTLKWIKDSALAAAKSFHLEKQAVTEVPIDEKGLKKMSVVYNQYNRYKHGGIAVKIRKVFNVNVQSQQIGWEEFLAEVGNAAKQNDKYYFKTPQFHGTASLPASMILRYGFSVIDAKLAREAGIKYAGKMLGAGIYSSNVLDKVAQYINDDAPTGVSRRRGAIGYIFEMETQGTNWGRMCDGGDANFATGGTREFPREVGGLVSPEWAWRYPNQQCKIKRCYEIELIDKAEMDEMIVRNKDVMEAIDKHKSFSEYLLAESAAFSPYAKPQAQFTFMDNLVPVGNGRFADFNENPDQTIKLPRGAYIDHGANGVTVVFIHTEDVYAKLLYATDIMRDAQIRTLYEKLLGRRV